MKKLFLLAMSKKLGYHFVFSQKCFIFASI